MNDDGNAKVGYTAPSVSGEAAVVVEALAMAGLTADAIGYIETHGTGTPMGDPMIGARPAFANRRAPG